MAYHKKNRNFILTSALVALGGLTLAATAPALASGGSGGGGGGLSTPQRQAVDPAVAYRAGLDAYQEGNYRKAAREFRKVISVDRKNPQANYLAGMSYIGLDKPKRALKYFRTAVKARPGFIQANEQYALTLVALEKMEDAQAQLQVMEEMLAGNTSEALAKSVERVRTAVETGQVPDQLNLALAPKGNTELGNLLYADAVRLINTEQYSAAITELYKTEFEVGLHADVQNYLGYTHRKLGRYEEAKSYYAMALKLNPEHLGAHEYLGELYIEIGDMKNARKQLASLNKLCGFGCEEREELARLVNASDIRVASRD